MTHSDNDYESTRLEMVHTQLRERNIKDERVLKSMTEIPRHTFISEKCHPLAYEDKPVSIGCGQTISQPYMVALMTQLLKLQPDSRVLEVGTGTGYQSAILGTLAATVISIERHPKLAGQARNCLANIGIKNVTVRIGDGTLGAPDDAPFDAIIVTAGGPNIPKKLMHQLKIGGRLVCPVGHRDNQELIIITRQSTGFKKTKSTRCRFVPLIGQEGWNG